MPKQQEPVGPPVPRSELEEIQIQTNAVQNEVSDLFVLFFFLYSYLTDIHLLSKTRKTLEIYRSIFCYFLFQNVFLYNHTCKN